MSSRRFDVDCLVDEDLDHIKRSAADVGAFIAQSVVSLVARSLKPRSSSQTEFRPDQEFSIGWVRKYLGVSSQTIRNRVSEGRLRATKTETGKFRFLWKDIQEYQNGVHLKNR